MNQPPADPGSASVHFTYDDYLRFPDDGQRHEIIAGKRYVTPAPTTRHQLVLGNLYTALRTFLDRHALGTCLLSPVDLHLADDSVVQPDLVYVSRERRAIIERQELTAAPDLAVEILSPSTRRTDYRAKRQLYARHGVREYWILDPEVERVEVYVREDAALRLAFETTAGEVASAGAVPGFTVTLAALFAMPE